MADPRDDALRQRYRELATEEPSAALDDAIRAAARRAVSSGPGQSRKPGVAHWAVPASVAAVLFLSFSVVMRLEKEAPPIAEPAPSSIVASKEPAPAAAPVQPPKAASARVEATKEQEAPRDKLREQPRTEAPSLLKEKKDAPVVTSKTEILADAIAPAKPTPPAPVASPAAPPPPASPASPAFAPPPPAASMSAPAPMPPERAAARAAEEQSNVAPGRRDEARGMLGAQGAAQAPRAKAEAHAEKRIAEASNLDAPWPDTPEKKLERIEALRKAGRDKEADDAIARFRREHPEYRIPEDLWNKIKPQ